jgi:acetyl esterase/lipase
MPSLRARLLPVLLRCFLKPRLRPSVSLWQQRSALRIWAWFGRLPARTERRKLQLGGIPAEQLQPRGHTWTGPTVLLLHGGGYCWGGIESHRELAARISHAAGRPVTVIDYRRAPESPYPAAVDDALSAYLALRRTGAVAVVGDSAGGGLALALCLRLKQLQEPLPERLALISPWTDLTQSGGSITDLAQVDPVISPASLEQCSERYRGDKPAELPEISPLFGELEGFPPTLIQVGANEVLLDDSRRLKARLGAIAVLEVTPEMWHVWHLFASIVPEGAAAIGRLGRFLASGD